jgi:hypothetical protein
MLRHINNIYCANKYSFMGYSLHLALQSGVDGEVDQFN